MRNRLLLLADAVLIVLVVALAIRLASGWRDRPTAPRESSSGAPSESAPPAPPAPPATRAPLSAYAVVAERNLFSPTRTETSEPPQTAAAPGATTPPAPKPRLWGVLLGIEGGRAYLEDPRTRKVFPYKIGDTVADSRLEQIQSDRVVLRRGGETYEVLLRDASKPRPPAPPVPTRTPGVTPGAPAVPGTGITGPTGGAPGRTPPGVPRRPFPDPARPAPAPPQPAPDAEEGE